MKSFSRAVFAILAVLAIASPATALTTWTGVTLVNNFDDGETANAPDAYRGSAGGGWAGGWSDWKTGNTGTVSGTVLGTNPLNVGGNYFSATIQNDHNDPLVNLKFCAGLVRDYLSEGFLDPTMDFTVDYSVRIDGSQFNTKGTDKDLFVFRIAPTLYYTSDGTECVTIYMRGDNTLRYYDGTKTAGAEGFPVTVGDVYNFSINVRPVDMKYDLAVTNTTNPNQDPFAASNILWRGGTGLGKYLGFYAQECTDLESFGFSLDAVRIHQNRTITIGGMYEVAARFNAGETTEAVDGFTGMAGDGWNTSWTKRNDRATLAATVKDALSGTELHAGTGNYLEMTATTGEVGTTGYSVGGISRDYQRINEAGIDWTEEHTIRFTVRMDEDVNNLFNMTFTDAHDRYDIFDSPYNRGGINAETTWGAYVKGDGEHEWQFINGGATAADSNILVTMGGVYDFTIKVKPETGKYDVTLTDGSATFNVTDLAWNTTNDYVGGVLCFMARGNVAGDVRAWSIDEILITQEAPAIPGDTNGDGYVDADDAATLASHWGQIGVTQKAAYGDFNEDGAVNAADASILAANWNPRSTEGTGALPEPGAILLVVVGGLTLAARRRR